MNHELKTGYILWYDKRDKNGIIIDKRDGTEFYFDVSVIIGRDDSNIRHDVEVLYKQNTRIQDVRCAHQVAVAGGQS